MSNNAPDFSTAFDMAGDALEEAEKRLSLKRRQSEKKAAVSQPTDDKKRGQRHPETESAPPLNRRAKPSKSDVQVVTKRHRTNLTLKVLAENEARFNELFFRLQLKRDNRKKQDLADEALQLLFAKYSQLLR
jgi:hypothetical protein